MVTVLCLAVSACTTPSAPAPDAPSTILLQKPVHFSFPDGADVQADVGIYRVEQATDKSLRLVPREKKESIVIQAHATKYDEPLSELVALSIPYQEDEHHVVLLMPDGNALDAVGTYSGVKTRATATLVPLSSLNIQQYETIQQYRRTLRSLPPPKANEAVACTKDQGDPQSTTGRDLDGYMLSDPSMTNMQCRNSCASRGFVFAGTQNGSYCFCGKRYGQLGPATNCDMGCSGNNVEICGGTWANSVSLSGAEPTIPTPPTNGAQCAIAVVGSYEDTSRKIVVRYRHIEVQRWEVTGPPTPSGTGYLLPILWTTTGSGFLHEDNGAGVVNDFKWGVSGAHRAAFQQVRWGYSWKISQAQVPLSTVLDGIVETQQQTINGVVNPIAVKKTPTGELAYGDILTYGFVTNQADLRPVSNYSGYRQPDYARAGGLCEAHLKLGPP
jgi:hypothetical protein